jgi:hypothetical protein
LLHRRVCRWRASLLSWVGFGLLLEEIEEWPDLVVGLGGVAHCCPAVDEVVVAAADTATIDDPCLDEISDDSLRGPLGDSDLDGDLSERGVDVLGDADEHLRVVRQEGPGSWVIVT